MTTDFYKHALEAAVKELTDLLMERDDLDAKRDEIDRRVKKVRDGLYGLSTLAGDDRSPFEAYPELFDMIDPDIGLTDAVREVLKAVTYGSLSPVEVRDELRRRGFDLDKYKNILPSIHTILKRLLKSGEVKAETVEGKAVYKWSRPESQSVWGNLLAPKGGDIS